PVGADDPQPVGGVVAGGDRAAATGQQQRGQAERRPHPRSASAVCASAGKNDSIDSSATVMSTAVPNVVTVLKKLSPFFSRRGTNTSLCGGRSSSSGPG